MPSTALRSSLPLLLVAALSATGCLSPYLKRAADAPEPKPSPALVSGFVVHFDSNGEEKSLVGAAIDAAQNAGLDEFGKKATELLTAALEERGYTAAWDGPRSAKLDLIQISSNAGSAALTGQWRHPESSHWIPQAVDSLFTKPIDVISKIKGDGKEYFAFADILIRDSGMILKEPWVVVRAVVYDQDAKKVLDLQGIGTGNSQVFVADRSPKNLEVALIKGFESLKAVKEEAL